MNTALYAYAAAYFAAVLVAAPRLARRFTARQRPRR